MHLQCLRRCSSDCTRCLNIYRWQHSQRLQLDAPCWCSPFNINSKIKASSRRSFFGNKIKLKLSILSFVFHAKSLKHSMSHQWCYQNDISLLLQSAILWARLVLIHSLSLGVMFANGKYDIERFRILLFCITWYFILLFFVRNIKCYKEFELHKIV